MVFSVVSIKPFASSSISFIKPRSGPVKLSGPAWMPEVLFHRKKGDRGSNYKLEAKKCLHTHSSILFYFLFNYFTFTQLLFSTQVTALNLKTSGKRAMKIAGWSSSPTPVTQFWQQPDTSKEVFDVSEHTQLFSPGLS